MRLISLAIVLVWCVSAQATDYYLSAAGSDSNNCTSTGTACQNLSRLASFENAYNPGDTINLRCGDVFGSGSLFAAIRINRSGTMGNPIIVRRYGTCSGSNDPIIRDTGAASPWGINVAGNWVVIENLRIENFGHAIRVAAANDGVIRNVVMANNDDFGTLRIRNSSARWTVDNVHIFNDLNTQKECIYLGTGNVDTDVTNNITIVNSNIEDCGAEGIEFKPGTHTGRVANNYIHDFRSSGSVGVKVTKKGGLVVENNWIQNIPETGILIHGNATVRNNLVKNTGYAGASPFRDKGIRVQELDVEITALLITQNTVVDATDRCIEPENDPQTTVTNNIGWGCGSGNNAANPLFENAASDDYRLQAGSPVLGQGAFPSPSIASCEIGEVNDTTLVVNISSAFPPLSAAQNASMDVEYDSVDQTENSTVIAGDNQARITMAAAPATQSVAVVLKTLVGAFVDSANVGGSHASTAGKTVNGRSLANAAGVTCVNNTGGATLPTIQQTYAAIMAFDGDVNHTDFKSKVNQNYGVVRGGSFVLLIKIAATGADPVAQGFRIQYNKDGGAFANVPETCDSSEVCMVRHPIIVHRTNLTGEVLPSDHATDVPGQFLSSQAALPALDLSVNSEAEQRYAIKLDMSATLDSVYCFRIYTDAGTALSGYLGESCAVAHVGRLNAQ